MSIRDNAALEADTDRKRKDIDIWELVLMCPFIMHMEQHVQACQAWSQTFAEDKRLNYRSHLRYAKRQTYDRFAAVYGKPSEHLAEIHEEVAE